MPTNLTDSDSFTDPIQGPADADPQLADSYNLGFQGLANRTRHLRNFTGANEASRVVRMGAHEAATRTGTWETHATLSALRADQITRGSLTFEATAGGLLPWKGSVTQVQVQVEPGTVKEAPENQIRASLYRVEVDPSIVAQVGSTVVCPSNTATLQIITLPGTTVINGEATSGNNYRLIVVVESGEGLAGTDDLIYDVRFTTTATVR